MGRDLIGADDDSSAAAFRNAGACKDMFAGGPTPQECVGSVVQGFKEYTARPRG